MGARTLFPEFSCNGNACTIVAPPNAHVSPPGWFQLFVLDGPTPSHSEWVRIGGDPGALGELLDPSSNLCSNMRGFQATGLTSLTSRSLACKG